MASPKDLSTRETPLRARPQRTFRRETTLPRSSTDLPELGVFANIQRPNMSGADQLQKILGLASETAKDAFGRVQKVHDENDAADALLDFGEGHKDDERFAKSRAYRDAWQLEGSKDLAVKIGTEAQQKFEAALHDPDHPATLEDLDAIFEGVLHEHLFDEHGQPINLITPQAKATLGNALARLKQELMPKAAEAIADNQNERLFNTKYSNMAFERDAGEAIGSPPAIDPLAPLDGPDGAQAKPQTVSFGKPTGRLPIQGAITNTFAQHAARGSAGLDIDGKMGDPVSAPAGGKVVAVSTDSRSGLFVKVDHGNGVVSSYAHLSAADVKVGDVIQAGARLGAVGNSGHVSSKSGDGSHLHYRIRVNGKDVNPLAFNFQEGGAATFTTGQEPQLKQAAFAQPAPGSAPGFDLDGFIHDLPPSVDKGKAKTWLLQRLVADAWAKGDPTLLDGLETSKRANGIPSLTPNEALQIVEKREQLRDRLRVQTKRAEDDLHRDNADLVLDALNHGNPPSKEWLADQASAGLLDEGFANAMINHLDVEQRQELAEAKSESRIAQRELDDDLDAEVYAMEAERRAGILTGASYQDDLKRFQSGELGTGKKAGARFKRLMAATKVGQQAVETDPKFARYSAELATNFKPRKAANGNLLMARPKGELPEPVYKEMVAYYEEKVHAGMDPGEAYREAVRRYGAQTKAPKDKLASIREEMAAMRARKAAAGH